MSQTTGALVDTHLIQAAFVLLPLVLILQGQGGVLLLQESQDQTVSIRRWLTKVRCQRSTRRANKEWTERRAEKGQGNGSYDAELWAGRGPLGSLELIRISAPLGEPRDPLISGSFSFVSSTFGAVRQPR